MARTRLDAINTCLRGIGIAPVATEDDPDLDAATAGQVIDQVSMDIQSRGWFFNREAGWVLQPNITTGAITVPPATLSIISSGASRGVQVMLRGTQMYDIVNHTFDLRIIAPLPATIEFTSIVELEFDYLPPAAKLAITFTARRQFAQDLEVDQTRWKFQMNDEKAAMAQLLREDSKNKKRNYLRDNTVVASFLSRVGGLNADSASVGYFPNSNS